MDPSDFKIIISYVGLCILFSFFFSVTLFRTYAALYRNFCRIDFIFCFYVGMPGSCCHIVWESKRTLYQNTCWRSWWLECGGNCSFTSLSYSVHTGHRVPLSQLTPYPATPLAIARNCWQLIEFLGVDCVELWVAQSILKRTWKEQWSRTHRLAVCAALHCSVQHRIISELWTGCYLL
jgi:hypothetical protein